jgi:hypothetical protein
VTRLAVIERKREHANTRYVRIAVLDREVLNTTYRLARWDRRLGRYFELHLFGRHIR